MGDWGWVAAAYVTVIGALATYAWLLVSRIRRAREVDGARR